MSSTLPNGQDSPAGLQVWAVDMTQRMRRACSAAAADLSVEQWQRYIADYTGEPPHPTCPPAQR